MRKLIGELGPRTGSGVMGSGGSRKLRLLRKKITPSSSKTATSGGPNPNLTALPALGAGLLTPPEPLTGGLPDLSAGDLRSGVSAGSGDPRRAPVSHGTRALVLSLLLPRGQLLAELEDFLLQHPNAPLADD